MTTKKRKPENPDKVRSRVENARQRARDKGYVRRDYYATPAEHGQLKDHLQQLRDTDNE